MSDTNNILTDSREMLGDVKLLLEITDSSQDTRLMFLLEDTAAAVMSYCRPDMLPRQLEGFVVTIAAKRFTDGRGGVKSITEGERRVEYRDEEYDFLSEYAARLRPFMSRAAFVPSDKDGGKNG